MAEMACTCLHHANNIVFINADVRYSVIEEAWVVLEHCLLTVIPLKRQTPTDALCMSTAMAVGFVIFGLANLFSSRTKASN